MIVTKIVDYEIIKEYNWGFRLRLFFFKTFKKSESHVYNLSLKQFKNLHETIKRENGYAAIDNHERYVWSGNDLEFLCSHFKAEFTENYSIPQDEVINYIPEYIAPISEEADAELIR